MECPSCRKDLSRFEYLYHFCPLCSAPLPDRIRTKAREGGDETRATEEKPEWDRGRAGTYPEDEAPPPFEAYWRREPYQAKRSNVFKVEARPFREPVRLSIKAEFLSIGLSAERDAVLRPGRETAVHFYFKPETAGTHMVRLTFVCRDTLDNPTMFETGDTVFFVDETPEEERHTTYNIGDIISVGEVSLGGRRPAGVSVPGRGESPMVRLEVFYNDEGTRRMRRIMRVDRLMGEARKLYTQGSGLVEALRRVTEKKGEGMGEAVHLLEKAREKCFQVRDEEPDHEESLGFIGRIGEILGGPLTTSGKGMEKECPRFDSCVLSLGGFASGRKIFLFSKERIVIGTDRSSDIVVMGTEYVSGTHALIKVNKYGQFFIRDTGSDGKGSTNGTFLNGRPERIMPNRDYPVSDGTIANLGASLGLFFRFIFAPGYGGPGKPDRTEPGTVTGEPTGTGTCPAMDARGIVNALAIKTGQIDRRDEYIILLREITVGTRKTNAVVLRGSGVSDTHARIIHRDGLYLVEDLNSPGGTFLNGSRLDPGGEYLLSGDAELALGDVVIKVGLKG